MNKHTHQTAPTQFVEDKGIRFAYRRFGKQGGVPLVFIPHILGNLGSQKRLTLQRHGPTPQNL